jgi:putative redox protein
MSQTKEAIARTGEQPYLTNIVTGGHDLVADEPEVLGGGNKGPTPNQLLASALASCTSITLKMYADRKGIDLGTIEVKVTMEENAEQKHNYLFHRVLKLEKEQDAAFMARLLTIAEACPVSKLLKAGSHTVASGWA